MKKGSGGGLKRPGGLRPSSSVKRPGFSKPSLSRRSSKGPGKAPLASEPKDLGGFVEAGPSAVRRPFWRRPYRSGLGGCTTAIVALVLVGICIGVVILLVTFAPILLGR